MSVPSRRDLVGLLEGAQAVVARAADTLVTMQFGGLRPQRKELLDIVTEADLAAEKIVIDGLQALAPGVAILAEESGATGKQDGPRWIIDPLDGTINYASGLPFYSVTVAYEAEGAVRVGVVNAPGMGIVASYAEGAAATVNGVPVRVREVRSLSNAVVSVCLTSNFSRDEVAVTAAIIERLGTVARGVRLVVSSALEMCLVATGRIDGFVSIKADVVSYAAGLALVRAAGGRVTNLRGADSSVDDLEKISSNGWIHEELLRHVNEASDRHGPAESAAR
ncbi:MAG TPA: inositol monophosphatase family protein [Ramlibacter sp.]|nr:inositol monophosphatase family protein [Ramlibacter sp.]